MHSDKTLLKKRAEKSVWHPVCIVLNDGSYYIGTITEVGDKELTVSAVDGRKNTQATKRRKGDRVQVSGILNSLFGAGGSGGGLNLLSMLGGLGGGASGGGSGALAGAGSLAGGAGGVLSGSGGILGLMGKIWPIVKMGFGMLKSIIPLVGGLLKKKNNNDNNNDNNDSNNESNNESNNDNNIKKKRRKRRNNLRKESMQRK